MNLQEMRTSLQAKGYGTDTVAAQNEAINSAYRRLVGRRRWPWLEAQGTIPTVAGTSAYAVTSLTDFVHIDAVRLEVGTEYPYLTYADPQQVRDSAHSDRDRGTPRYWTFHRGQLHIWPVPDRVYTMTIDYTKDPPDLSDGGSPIFAQTYHDILVWGAVAEIAFRERDWPAVDRAEQKWTAIMGEMEREYGIRQRQNATHVKQSSFWSRVGGIY